MTEEFYLLDIDYRVESKKNNPDSTIVNIYGKTRDGKSITVEISKFRPYFYVSFSTKPLYDYVRNALYVSIKKNNKIPICGITSIKDTKSMIINKNHNRNYNNVDKNGILLDENYGNTLLNNVYRIYVRTFSDIIGNNYSFKKDSEDENENLFVSAVHEIYKHVNTFGLICKNFKNSENVQFYETNVDPYVHILNRLEILPCSWITLDVKKFKIINSCENKLLYTHTLTSADIIGVERNVGKKDNCYSVLFLKKEKKSNNNTDSSTTNDDDNDDDNNVDIAPDLSLTSFDIECVSSDINSFPNSKTDKIIQISAVTVNDSLMRNVSFEDNIGVSRHLFSINSCDEIANVEIHSFKCERDMLIGFLNYMRKEDPDIITGYNIVQFDLPYLIDRLATHEIPACIGDVVRKSSYRKFKFGLNQTNVVVPGKLIFDVYMYLKKEFPMKSMKLNSVSEVFLNKQKDDVNYKEIPVLFRKNSTTRAILGKYCVKDSELVLEIIKCKQSLLNMYERCKIFCTVMSYMTTRGQQVRIESMLHWFCRNENILIDDMVTYKKLFGEHEESFQYNLNKKICKAKSTKSISNCDESDDDDNSNGGWGGECSENDDVYDDDNGNDDNNGKNIQDEEKENANKIDKGGKSSKTNYDGAFVLDPKVGIYRDHPIVCLDFASLYPSIMIAFNLCHTTLINNHTHGEMLVKKGIAEKSPVGYYFIKSQYKQGVLPMILRNLLSKRNEVKRKMKFYNSNSVEYLILNGQQLAVKVAANSIYGDCGAQKGKLFNIEIPSSVTAYGRQLLVKSKSVIEEKYENCEIVYGDTDSVMVHIKNITKYNLWDSVDLGKTIAAKITRLINRPPITLQFENVSLPFLLISKKRYAYMVHENLEYILEKYKDANNDESRLLKFNELKPKLKYKGIEVVRRDNCRFSTDIQKLMLNLIMNFNDNVEEEKKVQQAPIVVDDKILNNYDKTIIDTLKCKLKDLLDGNIDVKNLIVSKEWKIHTKNPTIHDELVKKICSRDMGLAPSSGDRVQYVIIKGLGPVTSRSEDPSYAIDNKLKLDYEYYCTLVVNQLTTILSIYLGNNFTKDETKYLILPEEYVKYLIQCKKDGRNRKRKLIPLPGNSLITNYFQSKKLCTD